MGLDYGTKTVGVAISDALGPVSYTHLMEGIRAALEQGMRVKINCVALNECNEFQWGKLAALAKEYPLDVRFIEMMPIGLGKAYQGSMQEVIQKNLENIYGAAKPDSGAVRGNGPAVYWEFPGFQGKIGFISAISHKFRCV